MNKKKKNSATSRKKTRKEAPLKSATKVLKETEIKRMTNETKKGKKSRKEQPPKSALKELRKSTEPKDKK